jgi:hypothetical protein
MFSVIHTPCSEMTGRTDKLTITLVQYVNVEQTRNHQKPRRVYSLSCKQSLMMMMMMMMMMHRNAL